MPKAHQFPQPMWRADGTLDYAPNAKELELMKKDGWSEKLVTMPFPKAVHGPEGQSIRVNNAFELEQALANGWALKPVVEEERPIDAPPNFDAPPKQAAKRRGRPPLTTA